jgi:hypothetical protein
MSSSRSPQSARGSAQAYEKFSKGEVNIGINALRKDGGPENEGASKVTSDLSIESVNQRAYPARRK